MAKSKAQKKLEADFRVVRGNVANIVRSIKSYSEQLNLEYPEGVPEWVTENGQIEYYEDKLKKEMALYKTFPKELQIEGFEGWVDVDKEKLFKDFEIN